MTRDSIICELARRVKKLDKKKSGEVLNIFIESISEAIARGEKVEIRGFGVFKLRKHKAQLARNPRTGEQTPMEAKKYPMFKASRLLNRLVENGS